MTVALDESLRYALSTALRALDERVALAKKLGTEAREHGHNVLANSWARRAAESEQEAAAIRDSIKRIDEMGARIEADSMAVQIGTEQLARQAK